MSWSATIISFLGYGFRTILANRAFQMANDTEWAETTR